MDVVEGFVAGIGVCFVMLLIVGVSAAYKKEMIADQCDTVGAFQYQGAVYDCKRRVVGNP